MPEQRPYFPWYPKDWLGSASVSAMPLAAQGLYMRLISFAWLSDGLPADGEALRRLAGVERAEWKRVWPLVAPLWEDRDGRLYQSKQERVRQEQTAYTTSKSIAGKKGGRRSVEARTEAFGSADPRSNREARHEAEREAEREASGEAVVKPSSASSSAKKRTPQPPKGEWRSDLLFVRFYEAYPRREAPKAAFKAWVKLNADEPLLQRMLAALKWQIPAHEWGPGNAYTPLPATWLNAGRWDDARDANGTAAAATEKPIDNDWWRRN
jgi:uncharacterized protein YdaU (DUF1376 family)